MSRSENPRELKIAIEPFSPGLAIEIAGAGELSFGEWREGPHSVKLWIEPPGMRRDLSPEAMGILTVILSIPANIASSLIAKWLSETLTKGKRPPRSIRIQTRIVEFDKGEIQRVIEEELELGERD